MQTGRQMALIDNERIEKIIPRTPLESLRKLISKVRLFPKTHNFFEYFEKESANILVGAKILCRMIAHKEERPELVKELKECEHVGDKLTHEVIDLLHQTFITPFDRSDIHTLVVKMDDILDIIDFIGNRLTVYNITEMPDEIGQLAEIVFLSTKELSKAMAGLERLKDTQRVLNHCIEVNRLENEADEKTNNVIEKLFNNNWEAIQIIKLKELVENLEAAEDKCEDVANIIENIILKNA